MKKFGLFIIIIICLSSCTMQEYLIDWYSISDVPKSLEDEIVNSDNIELTIHNWSVDNIEYKFYANGFVPAQETLDKKNGNCANKTLLVIALNYKITGEKAILVYCRKSEGLHYTTKFKNKGIIEPGILEVYEEIKFEDISQYIYWRQ